MYFGFLSQNRGMKFKVTECHWEGRAEPCYFAWIRSVAFQAARLCRVASISGLAKPPFVQLSCRNWTACKVFVAMFGFWKWRGLVKAIQLSIPKHLGSANIPRSRVTCSPIFSSFGFVWRKATPKSRVIISSFSLWTCYNLVVNPPFLDTPICGAGVRLWPIRPLWGWLVDW